MTQNAHENEQPSWIFTNARVRSSRGSLWTHADGADIARDRGGGLLPGPRDDVHVLGHARERVLEVRRAAGDVDAPVRARGPRRSLSRLGDGLVRHAAGVDDRDLGAPVQLLVPVGEQSLPRELCIREGHLAAEEAHGEGRHRSREA